MTFITKRPALTAVAMLFLLAFAAGVAAAHGVAEGDKGYIEQTSGPQIGAFLYLGVTFQNNAVRARGKQVLYVLRTSDGEFISASHKKA